MIRRPLSVRFASFVGHTMLVIVGFTAPAGSPESVRAWRKTPALADTSSPSRLVAKHLHDSGRSAQLPPVFPPLDLGGTAKIELRGVCVCRVKQGVDGEECDGVTLMLWDRLLLRSRFQGMTRSSQLLLEPILLPSREVLFTETLSSRLLRLCRLRLELLSRRPSFFLLCERLRGFLPPTSREDAGFPATTRLARRFF
jgi:hypothetical protein